MMHCGEPVILLKRNEPRRWPAWNEFQAEQTRV